MTREIPPVRDPRAAVRLAFLWGAILSIAVAWTPVCFALQAGTARVNITPLSIEGIPMSGYAGRDEKGAVGLHDSLYARVLVLDDGDARIAVASLDLIGLNVDFDPAPGRLARLLRGEGMDGWLMVATHTHGGPGVLDLTRPYQADRSWPPDAPYVNWLEDRITEAVRAAGENLRPVRLSAGRGHVDLSFNRRRVKPDGSVEMIWGRGRQFTPDQLGPTDPEVGVVRIDDLSGKPVAVLFNYACHAVVLGSGNRRLTADFPGYAMAYVEAQYPGCTALFLQGAAGDLDPYIDVQDDFGPARDQGEELGREVVRVARDLEAGEGTAIEEAPRIEWIPLARTFHRFQDTSRQVTLHFYLLRLGSKLVFAAFPGEPFVELQLDLKARSPLPLTFLLGYTNGYTGYHPTRQANREGGYGASYGRTMHVEPGSGEAMVEAVLEELRRRVGTPSTEIVEEKTGLPERFRLEQNFPNPFNSATRIRFVLPRDGRVELAVYDLLGRKVAVLKKGTCGGGAHEFQWDGRDFMGRPLASGVYLYRLQAGGRSRTRKSILLR